MQSKHGFETTESRSRLMSKIKSSNTQPEIILRKALWGSGIRYRLNNASLTGKPDIIIRKYKIVIFVDGEFWHGFDWVNKKKKIKSNREYWISKIERNINRDIAVNNHYIEQGWHVIRFWENDIRKRLEDCLQTIREAINNCQTKSS